MEIKNGQINGVLQKLEIEWVASDETTETKTFMWADLDSIFIKAIIAFLIRNAEGGS